MNLSVVVSLVDRLSGPLGGVRDRLNALRNSTVGRALGGVGMAMSGVASEAGKLAAKLGALGAAGGFALKGFIGTAAKYEQYEIQLKALEGTAEAAKTAMDWVEEFATATPLELDGVMNAYVKLKAFGIDPMSGSLQGMVDVNAKLGGGQEKLEGIVLAVGQAWAKQKLQGEEILQLVERGVPVWDLLAKVTGKNSAQLSKMSEKGQLGRDVIAALNVEMGRWAAGSAEAMRNTWAGRLSELSDYWTKFQRMVMDAGLFDWLNNRLASALERLNAMAASGELRELATVVGTRLKEGAIIAWEAIKQLIGELRNAWAVVERVRDAVGGWRPIMIAVAAVIAGPLLASIALLVLMVANLALALGPVGWGVMAVLAIWARFGPQIMEAIGSAIDYIKRIPGAVADVALAITPTVLSIIDYFKRIPSEIADLVIEIVAAFNGLPDKLMSIGRNIIDGLLAGMMEKWVALKEWVGGLAEMLPEWVRKPLDTHSPSRVFAKIGGDLMRGLEVGIAARERMPGMALRSVASGLAMAGALSAPVSIAGAVGGGSGAGPISMPITITITAPAGADAQQLAALVRTQVEQATREAGRRLSGALYDQPDNM